MIKLFYLKNPKDFDDYELLDTGGGEKLEKFGPYTFIRPYEGAVWPKALGMKDNWAKADGKFWSSKTGAVKGWKMKNKIDKNWEMSYKGIKFLASPTPFRHLGFFPEQASHWDFIEEKIGEKIFASSNFLDSKKIPKKLLSHGSHSNLNVVNETNIAYAEKSTNPSYFITTVFQNSAPMLVPLIEEGEKVLALQFIKKYLKPFLNKKLDAIVLGCTHYPFYKKEIKKILGKKIKVISQDEIIPKKLKDYLLKHSEIEKKLSKNKKAKILVTDITPNIKKLSQKWFGKNTKLECIQL